MSQTYNFIFMVVNRFNLFKWWRMWEWYAGECRYYREGRSQHHNAEIFEVPYACFRDGCPGV